MKYTNEESFSLSIAVWLMADFYDHNRHAGKLHMSATGLLKPIRQIILSQRTVALEDDDSVTDIKAFIPSRMGTAIHDSIERAWLHRYKESMILLGYPQRVIDRIRVNPTEEHMSDSSVDIIPVFVEKEFSKEMDDYIISGKTDFIGQGTLEDFKTTGVWGYMKGNNDEQYIKQGSIYRWLDPDTITEDFMKIQMIFTDWSPLDAIVKKKAGYPHSRIITKKLELMSLIETENFVKSRIREIAQNSLIAEENLPLCTPEELWQDKTVYKYFGKPENKRSSGNFDTYAEAHAKMMKMGKGIIKEVHGRIKRCGYCDGFALCTQKDTYLANRSLILK